MPIEKESIKIEYKKSFDKETIESICAFANTKGGTIFIGVDDNGIPIGIDIGKENLQQWINQIKQLTSPSLIPDIEEVNLSGKNVITISIPEYPVKPVACRGRYYLRVGNANHLMSLSQVVDLHLRTFNRSWDYHFDNQNGPESIAIDKVHNFIEMANRYRDFPITDTPLEVLKKLELERDGKISNGCFLLFMADESTRTAIELGRFESETIIKDGIRLKCDLFTEIEKTLEFIKKHISKRFEITE
jgi:ATP-dependent DNA helicase RecG